MEPASLLGRLTEATGISGHELEVRGVVRDAWSPFVDAIREDALGNLIAHRPGAPGNGSGGTGRSAVDPPPSVLLAGHQDEIGLMVTHVEDGGFLRFTTVGGWDPRVLLAQPVTVHGAERLPGVVGTRPPHVLGPDTQKSTIPVDDMFIDVGLAADDVRARVRVGDAVTMRRRTVNLGGDRWAGKAMDNRASVLAITVALEALAVQRHVWDVYAVATAQEEIGLKGAATAAWGIRPTIAVALDVTFAKQPGANEVACKLGGGPVLGFGPNIHPRIYSALCGAADALEMAYQVEPIAGHSGTDAWAIQVARGGIPTGLVGIPLRYMHTTVEAVALKDIERAGRLVGQFVAGLDAAFADGLVEDVGV